MIRPFLHIELAARSVEERAGAVSGHDLENGLAVTAEDERALVAGGSLLAHEGRAGRNDRCGSALPGWRRANARGLAQVDPAAVAGRPLVVPASHHVVDFVPAAARSARITGWPVVGHYERGVRRESQPEGIAQSDRPDGVGLAEGVVGRNSPVRVVGQDLAAQVRGVLRQGSDMILARGDVQLAVATEGEAPALVAAVRPGGKVVDDSGEAGARPTLIPPAHDALPGRVVGAAVEGVDEVIVAECRAQRQAQESSLAIG